MCILFAGLSSHKQYPLIICANRDEYHVRPTAAAHVWSGESQIIAGKDLQAGGSWLGINHKGEFAAITNIREPSAHQPGRLSRGELVIKALEGRLSNTWLTQHSPSYNPFNLIYQQKNSLFCFNSIKQTNQRLNQGFHAISNGFINEPWPKMTKGLQALQTACQQSEINSESLINLMQDESLPKDSELPNTGINLEWEKRLASIFIRHPDYGTRSTSIITKDINGLTTFLEVRYNAQGVELSREKFSLMCDHE